MRSFIVVLMLAGCAQLPPESVSLQNTLQMDADIRINTFNKLRSANLPYPTIILANLGDIYGHEDFGTIEIDYSHCMYDMNDCLNDTIPHELGHEAVDYLSPKNTYQTFSKGKLAIHNVNSDGDHGPQWCDAMRAMGGVPEKHGYCR